MIYCFGSMCLDRYDAKITPVCRKMCPAFIEHYTNQKLMPSLVVLQGTILGNESPAPLKARCQSRNRRGGARRFHRGLLDRNSLPLVT